MVDHLLWKRSLSLVVEDLDVDILAGMPFMTSNDVAVRPAKREIIIAGCDVASYDCSQSPQTHYAVRACHLLCAPIHTGEFVEIDAPSELLKDATLAIEPRMDSVSSSHLKSTCLLYTSPSPRDLSTSRMPSSA